MKTKLISAMNDESSDSKRSLFEVVIGDRKVYVEHSFVGRFPGEDVDNEETNSYRIVSLDTEPFDDIPLPEEAVRFVESFVQDPKKNPTLLVVRKVYREIRRPEPEPLPKDSFTLDLEKAFTPAWAQAPATKPY